tara:strand:+ start:222 stop:422 length:201 start_codon:yes stop_codon:yes gene_type:complete
MSKIKEYMMERAEIIVYKKSKEMITNKLRIRDLYDFYENANDEDKSCLQMLGITNKWEFVQEVTNE